MFKIVVILGYLKEVFYNQPNIIISAGNTSHMLAPVGAGLIYWEEALKRFQAELYHHHYFAFSKLR
jgi:hypothetical protein